MPQKPDPETFMRELEEDPLARLTWWALDQAAHTVEQLGELLTWLRGGSQDQPISHEAIFTADEINYLKSQRLARIATISDKGQPEATVSQFEYDGDVIYIHGDHQNYLPKLAQTQSGRSRVALIIDDLLSLDPWQARGIQIYGMAEMIVCDAVPEPKVTLRIRPQSSCSWGIDGAA